MVICAFLDTQNQSLYFKRFNDALKSKNAEHVERLAHLLLVSGLLKGATCEQVLIPMMQTLPKDAGTQMAQDMQEMNDQIKGKTKMIAAAKKHPDNDEFVNLMKELEEMEDKAAELEKEVLKKMLEILSEEELQAGALSMEKAKLDVDLMTMFEMKSGGGGGGAASASASGGTKKGTRGKGTRKSADKEEGLVPVVEMNEGTHERKKE